MSQSPDAVILSTAKEIITEKPGIGLTRLAFAVRDCGLKVNDSHLKKLLAKDPEVENENSDLKPRCYNKYTIVDKSKQLELFAEFEGEELLFEIGCAFSSVLKALDLQQEYNRLLDALKKYSEKY